MTCEEMIYSNEYSDYMINFFEGVEESGDLYRDGCVNPIIERIAILHNPRPEDYLTNLLFCSGVSPVSVQCESPKRMFYSYKSPSSWVLYLS